MSGARPPLVLPPTPSEASFSRRRFIRLVGGGIIVLFNADLSDLVGQETRTRGYPTDFNAYLRIAADGRVTVYSGKIEMGQGVVTSLAQMAADELGVALASIDMVMGDTALCPFDNGTYGSMSTRFFGPALRAAAAEAKAVLVALASEKLKAPKEALRVEDGAVVSASDPKVRVTFGELANGQKIVRTLDGKAVTKSVAEFRVMGKPTKRLDARAKVTGKAAYAGDVRLPGNALREGPPSAGPRRRDEERRHVGRRARPGRRRRERGRARRRPRARSGGRREGARRREVRLGRPEAGVRRPDRLRPPPRGRRARARSGRRRETSPKARRLPPRSSRGST